MREPTREERAQTPPPGLRMRSKTTQAYFDMRRKILLGEYSAYQALIPKQIEESYQINNTSTQVLLMRLANEGLVQVLPVRQRTWPQNAAFNDYRVADLSGAEKVLAQRTHLSLPESATGSREILLLKIQYADAQIAPMLSIAEREKVVVFRERHRRADQTIVAVSDLYLPFWFAEAMPELEQPGSDVSHLMRHLGKEPAVCCEIVESVQASSIERALFELSPDDPAPLLRLERHTFDAREQPLAVQFLTLRANSYHLQYTFAPDKDAS